MTAQYRIGFPIACAEDSSWQYAIVTPTDGKNSYGWRGQPKRAIKSKSELVNEIYDICDQQPLGHIYPRIQFECVGSEMDRTPLPSTWSGRSGTAAMALSLAAQARAKHAPIVLISCSISFPTIDDFRGATLERVCTSRDPSQNQRDLLSKWRSATNDFDTAVLALVLHRDDVEFLPAAERRAVLRLTELRFEQLAREWKQELRPWHPRLVAVSRNEAAQLASALGISPAPFSAPPVPRRSLETARSEMVQSRDAETSSVVPVPSVDASSLSQPWVAGDVEVPQIKRAETIGAVVEHWYRDDVTCRLDDGRQGVLRKKEIAEENGAVLFSLGQRIRVEVLGKRNPWLLQLRLAETCE